MLEPTSPLTTAKDINLAIKKFFKNKKAKALVGVSKVTTGHPVFLSKISKGGFLKPFIGKKFISYRRQNLSQIFFFDGSIYLSNTKYYLKKKTFNHNKTIPMIFPKQKSFEVDDNIDYNIIKILKKNEEKKI